MFLLPLIFLFSMVEVTILNWCLQLIIKSHQQILVGVVVTMSSKIACDTFSPLLAIHHSAPH